VPLGVILIFEMSSTTFSPGEVITDTWLHPLPNLDPFDSANPHFFKGKEGAPLRVNPERTTDMKGRVEGLILMVALQFPLR
jgi:hypothetical protein